MAHRIYSNEKNRATTQNSTTPPPVQRQPTTFPVVLLLSQLFLITASLAFASLRNSVLHTSKAGSVSSYLTLQLALYRVIKIYTFLTTDCPYMGLSSFATTLSDSEEEKAFFRTFFSHTHSALSDLVFHFLS